MSVDLSGGDNGGDEEVTDGEEAPRSGLTYHDPAFLPPRRSLRDLPSLLRASVRLTYESAPRLFVLTIALDIVSGLGVAAQLLIGRQALEILLQQKSGHRLGAAAVYLVALFIVTVLVALAQNVGTEQGRVQAELVTRMAYDRILGVAERVELAAFESPQFFDRLQRAMINGAARPLQMTSGLTKLITSGVTALGICAVVLRLVPVLLPVAILAYVPLWLAMTRNSRFFYDFMFRIAGINRQRIYLQTVRQGRNEAKEVRAFGLVPLIKGRYDRLYDEYVDGLRVLARRRIKRSLFGSLTNSALLVVVTGLLGYLYIHKEVSIATAGTVIAALLQLSSQLQSVLSGAASLYEGSLFLGDYESFIATEEDLAARDASEELKTEPPEFVSLCAEDIEFTYPGTARPSLNGASIEIKAGEIVALVGENGSGKTTLAKVIAGLYQPSRGRVTWSGIDVRTLNSTTIRESIAIIFQDFIRYLMSAHENIAAGKWQAMDDVARVHEAAHSANAESFLQQLPDGYDTLLGKEFDGGYDLSVGQWQRVALARAFFREAPIVILDEPTSALDPRAEKELFDRIRLLLQGRSVLLISHRFSSVRSADRIYVLAGGKVKEAGNHSELMALDGLYAELFTLQAAAYLAEEKLEQAHDQAERNTYSVGDTGANTGSNSRAPAS